MRQSKSAGSPDNRTGHSRTHGNSHAIAYAHPGPNHRTGSYSGANGLPSRDIGNGHAGSLHAYPSPDSNTGANCYRNPYTSAAYTYPGADSDTDANSNSHTYAYPGANCYAHTRATHACAAHVYAHTTHASSAYIHTCAAYLHAGSTDGHTSAVNTNTQTAYPNQFRSIFSGINTPPAMAISSLSVAGCWEMRCCLTKLLKTQQRAARTKISLCIAQMGSSFLELYSHR